MDGIAGLLNGAFGPADATTRADSDREVDLCSPLVDGCAVLLPIEELQGAPDATMVSQRAVHYGFFVCTEGFWWSLVRERLGDMFFVDLTAYCYAG